MPPVHLQVHGRAPSVLSSTEALSMGKGWAWSSQSQGTLAVTMGRGSARAGATSSVPDAPAFCVIRLVLRLCFLRALTGCLTHQLSPVCQALCLALGEKTQWS